MRERVFVVCVVMLSVVALTATAVMAADNFSGTWKLNVAKSKYSPDPAPKSGTTKLEATADGLKIVADGMGLIRPGTRVDLARSAIGMAVRHGAPKPDISSIDALRRTLLDAKSIAYSASVSGTYLSTELFKQLGIADRVLPKSRRVEGGERVGAVVARGEAEIGFQQISELLPVDGIDFVGPLPPEVQRVTIFSAGVGAASTNPAVAKSFIDFLASPRAITIIRKTALEAVAVVR